MRLPVAITVTAFLAFRYYTTGDYMPVAVFLSAYAIYEVLSRVNLLGVLKPVAMMVMSSIAMKSALEYLGLSADLFVYTLSAGISLALGTPDMKYRHYLALIGSGIATLSVLLIPEGTPLSAYKLPALLSLSVLTITSALPVVSERFEFLTGERVILVILAAVVGVYHTTFRSALMPGLRNLVDWLIVAGLLIYFLGRLRLEIDEDMGEKYRHEPLDFEGWAKRAEREYVENGNPVPLVTFVVYGLSRAGADIPAIERVVASIVDVERIPKYAFGFEKELISRRRKKKRLEKLKELKRRIEQTGGEYGG